jgi:hypothetical protein
MSTLGNGRLQPVYTHLTQSRPSIKTDLLCLLTKGVTIALFLTVPRTYSRRLLADSPVQIRCMSDATLARGTASGANLLCPAKRVARVLLGERCGHGQPKLLSRVQPRNRGTRRTRLCPDHEEDPSSHRYSPWCPSKPQCAQTMNKFPWAERYGHAIVGTRFEETDLVRNI